MTRRMVAVAALASLAAGGFLRLSGLADEANALWAVATAVILLPLSWSVARALMRRDVGVDAIALVAMAAALGLGQYLAGAVVAVMLAGGNALEEAASRRARRELTKLVERAPRFARRRVGSQVETVLADRIAVGDTLLVGAGEIVPVDGVVESELAVLDESALSGEPLPVLHARGEPVRSGSANAGDAFEFRAIRLAADSAYASVVRLVRGAERARAPFVRMADRYAALLLPFTLAVAGGAWLVSGDPIRALAVLVVATPCPLILAAPIALISGVSRAARAGIIVKGAATIEQLGRARTVLLDKTGTLTVGTPAMERIIALDGEAPEETLRLAASVDQLSVHALGQALVRAAHEQGLELSFPTQAKEHPGQGIEGTVEGRRVTVGSAGWLRERGYDAPLNLSGLVEVDPAPGRARILVGIDGHLAGALVMADHLRDDARALVEDLRAAGLRHVAIVTGDEPAVGNAIGREAGVDRVYSDLEPAEKVEVVRSLRERPELAPVVMVGDGINDAPALALADVGIAMGAAGATIASETADAVIVVDRIDRVADAVRIGRRSLSIARQSVLAGIGLSAIAMGFAAAGFVAPVFGALLQEVIDVVVIANALRALRG